MSVLYVYYTVLYRKISGLRRRYNTYSTNITYETRAPLCGSVSYRPNYDLDPALDASSRPVDDAAKSPREDEDDDNDFHDAQPD